MKNKWIHISVVTCYLLMSTKKKKIKLYKCVVRKRGYLLILFSDNHGFVI